MLAPWPHDKSPIVSALEQARADVESCSARISAVLDQLGAPPDRDAITSRALISSGSTDSLSKPPPASAPSTGPITGTGSIGIVPTPGVVLRPLDLLLADLGALRSSANQVALTAQSIEQLLQRASTDCNAVAAMLTTITTLSAVVTNTRRVLDLVALYPPATLAVLRVRRIMARLEKVLARVAPPLRTIEGILDAAADKLDAIRQKVEPVRTSAVHIRDDLGEARTRYFELGQKYAWTLPATIETCVKTLRGIIAPLSYSIERSAAYQELPALRNLAIELTKQLDPIHQLQPLLTLISSLLDTVLGPLREIARLIEPLAGLADLLDAALSAISDLLDPLLDLIDLGLLDQIEAMLNRIEQDIAAKLEALKQTVTAALLAPFEPWLAKLADFEQRLQALWAPIEQALDTYRCYTGG